MKTVTIIAYRRPDYLRRCLDSLLSCRGIDGWNLRIYIDGPRDEKTLECERLSITSQYRMPISVMIDRAQANRGLSGNAFYALEDAYARGSEFNVFLEEDVIAAPDMLELADWFFAHPRRDDYILMSLSHLSTDGWDRPYEVREFCGIRVPWAYCLTPEKWALWRECWDSKTVLPTGPDWSFSFEAAVRGWWTLYPWLGRAYNIGREGGVHTVPEDYDNELGFSVWSGDGTKPVPNTREGMANIVEFDRGAARALPWMVDELVARGLPVPSTFRKESRFD